MLSDGINNWLSILELALVWLILMLFYSPLADRIASKIVKQPPSLKSFRSIQKSIPKLIMGIIAAWFLGGILEEFVFRWIILRNVESLLIQLYPEPIAVGVSILTAAFGAGLVHFYQGPRGMLIITQLSVLFGILFVMGGNNLYTVMLCHGLYDTIAFIRFANKKSRYSKPD